MAKTKATNSAGETGEKVRKPKGPRKPREYRFEIVQNDGTVESVQLMLTHKDSAKRVMEFLNTAESTASEDYKYRYTEMIVHQ